MKLKKKKKTMIPTVIPIVIGAISTVIKGLEKRLEDLEIRGRVETIQIFFWLDFGVKQIINPLLFLFLLTHIGWNFYENLDSLRFFFFKLN